MPLKSPARQLLTHDHFPTRIHSDEVKATLAEIHSDRSNTVTVHSDVSHGALLFANQLLLQHCHSLGWSAAGPYQLFGLTGRNIASSERQPSRHERQQPEELS